MAQVILSEASGQLKELYGELQYPIASIVLDMAEATEKKSIARKIFTERKSTNSVESYGSVTAVDTFAPVGENGAYPTGGFESGNFQDLRNMTWKGSFSISREMHDDVKAIDLNTVPGAFFSDYERKFEYFFAGLLANAVLGKEFSMNGQTFKTSSADGVSMFSKAHKMKVREGFIMLAQVPYKDGNGKRMLTGFGGINHTPACGDGELYDTKNLTADYYPMLAVRRARGLFCTLNKANGLAGRDVLMWVDGTDFYYNGVIKGTVADSRKTFYFLGPFVIIWPDKAYYNVTLDEFGSLEETYNSGAGEISFSDGTYAQVAAKANCIVTTGAAFGFEVGDAVTITGCAVSANNTVAIIREISDDKKTLRFYEDCFTISSGTSYTEAGAVTIARKLPVMDYLCQLDNRLWGCKGDDIYCSNLGNPKVWMDYDGLATGSWAVSVGSEGDFSGCVSFLGYAIFMKPDRIYKLYGSKPSDFKALESARLGLLEGCERSFAVAGETLFYRSRAGIVRYSGGYPYLVDEALGELTPDNAAGGSDGVRYYVSGTDKNGSGVFLCYDTRFKTWIKEDDTLATDFAFADGLYYLSGNEIWKIESADGCTAEAPVSSIAEFGDFYEGSPQKKSLSSVQILADVPDGAELRAYMRFDDDASWTQVGTLTGTKRMHLLPVLSRRCDFWRLRLEGVGQWKVYAIARQYAQGSDQN